MLFLYSRKKQKTNTINQTNKTQGKLDPVSPGAEVWQHSLICRPSAWKGFVLVFPAALILRPTCSAGDVPGRCRGRGWRAWCNGSILRLVVLFSSLRSISASGLGVKLALPHSLVSREGSSCLHTQSITPPVPPASVSSLPSPCLCPNCPSARQCHPTGFYLRYGCVSKPHISETPMAQTLILWGSISPHCGWCQLVLGNSWVTVQWQRLGFYDKLQYTTGARVCCTQPVSLFLYW